MQRFRVIAYHPRQAEIYTVAIYNFLPKVHVVVKAGMI